VGGGQPSVVGEGSKRREREGGMRRGLHGSGKEAEGNFFWFFFLFYFYFDLLLPWFSFVFFFQILVGLSLHNYFP